MKRPYYDQFDRLRGTGLSLQAKEQLIFIQKYASGAGLVLAFRKTYSGVIYFYPYPKEVPFTGFGSKTEGIEQLKSVELLKSCQNLFSVHLSMYLFALLNETSGMLCQRDELDQNSDTPPPFVLSLLRTFSYEEASRLFFYEIQVSSMNNKFFINRNKTMQEIIERNQALFGVRNLTKEEFLVIMSDFGSIDERCSLDSATLDQLYLVLSQKQNGEVTYASIEVLVFEFLIQQPVQLNSIREDDLGPMARRLPRSMVQQMDSELLRNLINFHKICQSRLNINYGDVIPFARLEQIGKALQNSLHLDTDPLLQYFSVLQDDQLNVCNADILQLINELERALYQTQKERVSIRASTRKTDSKLIGDSLQRASQQSTLTQQQTSEEILNFSSDEEKQRKDTLTETSNLNNHQKVSYYASLIYRAVDYLRQQKGLQKLPDGPRVIADILKLVQRIELKALDLFTWNEEKARMIEELYIERELVQSKLNSEEDQKRIKQEQINQMLEDNDALAAELGNNDTLIRRLQEQIERLIEQNKSQSMIESEARSKEIEIQRLQTKTAEMDREIQRVSSNNKALLDILSQYETAAEQKPPSQEPVQETKPVMQWQIDELQSHNSQLQQQLHLNDVQMASLNEMICQLQGQLEDSKRQSAHYKNLYESLRDDNIQLRNSIMRPSMTLAGMGRQSTMQIPNRISNLGMYRFERTSNIGIGNRPSSQPLGRVSAMHDLPVLQEQDRPKLNEIKEDDEEHSEPNTSPEKGREHTHINTTPFKDVVPSLVDTKENTDAQEEQKAPIDTVLRGSTTEQQFDRRQRATTDLINLPKQALDSEPSQLGVNFADFWDRYVQPESGTFKPAYNPEYKFLEFDENVLYEKDYLGLRDEKKALEILREERHKYNQQLIRCFSDAVFRIDGKGQRSRRVLFCTEFTMYFFESEKNFKLTRQFPVEKISLMIFSETSPILCCISVKGSCDDYLIETFKRSALNTYLTEILVNRKLALYDMQFKTTFMVRFKSFRDPKRIEDISKGLYMGGSKQSVFKVSEKMGMLEFHTKKLVGRDWHEVFVVLCDVGLLLFKKFGDFEPIHFVPIADALVIKNPRQAEKMRPNMIKISYETLEQEFLFCAKSPAETDEWHDLIHTAINKHYKQQSKMSFAQRSEIESQRSSEKQY